MSTEAPLSSSAASIDRDNPWPGLATFTEDQRAFFHGRDEEILDLTQLAERRPLVVLFGQSGLGKSSILQAGVFPRLRTDGFCPIYIRLDHAETAPTPSEQVKALVKIETTRVGAWTRPGTARPGETLWEFFHHRDDRLIDRDGLGVVPVLVFDQFEELFTLGAARGERRDRAVAFIRELAELVENRPSAQLVARLEQSSAEMDAFDFSRTDYRVIISLREDFLPDLETLKTIMPALMQKRMRLSRMTGTQALEAVLKPGGALVTEDVARAIVEFVAGARGGSADRLAEIDVEPALLSVVCRELNERRRASGQAKITLEQVSGDRREILNDFYERSVADLPAPMRAFVEDRLLTKSGFRDNLALETVLEEPGVTRALIDTLVARRLLRIEDRIGTQRVELTHDVLAEVIRASRDARQQRLALDGAEKQRQIDRAAAARQTRRQRWMIAGLAIAVVGLLIGAFFGIRVQRRAADQAARADLSTGSRLLDEGKVGEGLAYLVAAANRSSGTGIASTRILTALASRDFLLPHGTTLKLPSAPVFATYLADGRSLLVLDDDHRVRLINTAEGKVAREFSFDQKIQPRGIGIAAKNSAVFAVAFENDTVAVIDTATGRPRFTPIISPAPGKPASAQSSSTSPSVASAPLRFVLSPDGRWLAVFRKTGREISSTFMPDSTKIFDASTGEERMQLDGFNRNFSESASYSPFSPDGSRFVTSMAEFAEDATNSLRPIKAATELRSLPDGKVVAALALHPGETIFSTNFSADGKRVLAVGFSRENNDFFCRVYDAVTGAPVGPALALTRSRSSDIGLTPDGTRFCVITGDRSVEVFDAVTTQAVLSPLKHASPILSVRFSEDSRILATHSVDGTYRLWDFATGTLLTESSFKLDRRDEVAFSPTGRDHAVISASGVVRPLRLTRGPAAPLVLPRTPTSPTLVHFAPRPPARLEWFTTTHAKVFDVASGRFTDGGFAFPHPITGWFRPTFGVPLLAGQSVVVRLAESGPVPPRAWTMGDQGVAQSVALSGLPTAIGSSSTALPISASTRYGATIYTPLDGRRTLGIWDLRTGQLVGNIPQALSLRASDFSRDDSRIAILENTAARVISIYEIRTGKVLAGIKSDPKTPLTAVRFSPDSTRLITGDSWGTVQFWDATNGTLVQSVQAHGFGVTRFDFSDDNKFFASMSEDGSVQVWESANYTIVGAPRVQSGTTNGSFFNADGSRIATSARDGTARVWDTRSGLPLNDSLVHNGVSVAVASFSPDGRFLMTRAGSASKSDAQRLWAAPPADRAGRAPKWLLELATICAGVRLNDEGRVVSAATQFDRLEELRDEIARLPADDAYGEWARWFLSDSPTRPIAPGFTITPAEAEKLAKDLAAAAPL